MMPRKPGQSRAHAARLRQIYYDEEQYVGATYDQEDGDAQQGRNGARRREGRERLQDSAEHFPAAEVQVSRFAELGRRMAAARRYRDAQPLQPTQPTDHGVAVAGETTSPAAAATAAAAAAEAVMIGTRRPSAAEEAKRATKKSRHGARRVRHWSEDYSRKELGQRLAAARKYRDAHAVQQQQPTEPWPQRTSDNGSRSGQELDHRVSIGNDHRRT